MVMIYQYCTSDLIDEIIPGENLSSCEYDKYLRTMWNKLHADDNIFRYKLNIRGERLVPGALKFVMQLNPERATNRRKPQQIMSITQPFNNEEFHFNKIPDKEIIFCIANKDRASGNNWIIINSSPITELHSLICPSIDMCLPQIVTLDSLIFILEIMFLSEDRNMRIVYNSLCAMASVNHLHYHILEIRHRLLIEDMNCPQLKGCLYKTDAEYPASAFCFQIANKSEIETACRDMFKLFNFLMNNNIAHNFFMTKGGHFEDADKMVVRCFVFPRLNFIGSKDLSFNVAACELSGYFPMKDEPTYLSMTESDIASILEEHTKPVFTKIVDDIKMLF